MGLLARPLNGLKEIGVVWRGEVGRSLKSGRVIVLLVLFSLFTGLALTTIGWLARQVVAQAQTRATDQGLDDEATSKLAQEAKKQFVSSFYAGDDADLTETLLAIPLVLLVVFSFSMRFVPAFVALMGFDQIAGEIGPRSIRYLVVRVRRSSILLGKFLAQFTVLGLLMLVAVAMMVITARITNDDFELAVAALTFVKLWSASMVLSVPYLALTSLCSTLFRQSPVALVFNLIVLICIWLLALVGEAYRLPGEAAAEQSLTMLKSESPLGYLRYASVFHFAADLLHPHRQRFGAAGLAHLGYALVFLGLGFVVLRRRDL
jgi:ABC-type transport system involved in multi-copper enzyme maturation permease subunit